MIDEATDIATDKNLCVDLCVRYFSVKNEMMMMTTVFLGLVQVIETTGAALFEALESLISMFNMRWEDCVGYGCDGASNMVGQFKLSMVSYSCQSPELPAGEMYVPQSGPLHPKGIRQTAVQS